MQHAALYEKYLLSTKVHTVGDYPVNRVQHLAAKEAGMPPGVGVKTRVNIEHCYQARSSSGKSFTTADIFTFHWDRKRSD